MLNQGARLEELVRDYTKLQAVYLIMYNMKVFDASKSDTAIDLAHGSPEQISQGLNRLKSLIQQ